ncbi:MAG: efflux RND transporter periplasmic adaptor subunit [Cellvibrionaceae bacterium]
MTHSDKNIWQKIPKPLLILVVGGLAVFALLTLKPSPQKMPKTEPSPPQVAVVYAVPSTQALKVKSQGTVSPRYEIDLVTQVAGRIEKVNKNFVEGGFFKAGEALITIDKRDYELAVIKANARVAETAQVLATEKGRARQAQREWRDLGNTEANDLFLRKPQLAAAEAQLAAAKADLDKAKLDLERTTISAPFNGRVREAVVDAGQYVSPGGRIAKVYDTSVAEIRLPLSDKQTALVELPLGFRGDENNPGPNVLITGIIGGEQYQWNGQIVRTDASVDTNTRMYYAVAEVKDPFVEQPEKAHVPLVVGLFVTAEISGREIENVVKIPRRALFKNNEIYTLSSENRIQLKTVRVLMTTKDEAWITGKISEGEAIVVGGQNFLTPNMIVNPLPSAREIMATATP